MDVPALRKLLPNMVWDEVGRVGPNEAKYTLGTLPRRGSGIKQCILDRRGR